MKLLHGKILRQTWRNLCVFKENRKTLAKLKDHANINILFVYLFYVDFGDDIRKVKTVFWNQVAKTGTLNAWRRYSFTDKADKVAFYVDEKSLGEIMYYGLTKYSPKTQKRDVILMKTYLNHALNRDE